MKRFFPGAYMRLSTAIGAIWGVTGIPADEQRAFEFGFEASDAILEVRDDCARLELVVSLAAAESVAKAIRSEPSNAQDIVFAIRHLEQTIRDEMQSKVFMLLEPDKVPLAFELHCFGEEVDIAFPSAKWDIEEAARCLAFDRATATVFHLMRIMEVALRVLGGKLVLPPSSNRTWDAVLDKCEKEISKSFKDKSREWQAEEVFLATATARLHAVKDAWRNPTMHVEAKYTQGEAQDIYKAIENLMRLLATKLKETPNA